VVVGAPLLRQYGYEPGPLLEPGTLAAVISDDPEEVRRSPVDVGLVADLPRAVRSIAERVEPREAAADDRRAAAGAVRGAPGADDRRAPGADDRATRLTAREVLVALGERVAPETIVVEEAPSSRDDLLHALPARRPLGFLSAAMGGLGFAVPAAAGLRLADPTRPVVAVVGDGSALYGIHGLWSAARYGAGALYVVLSNGRYAIMDRLAGDRGPWPGFEEVDPAGLARSLGCPSQRIETAAELTAALDEIVPGLADRTEPLVLDVRVDRHEPG
jgi:benzoylformate decarboxylase